MINRDKIRSEINELKCVMEGGGIEIPSMWVCLWPGLILILWLLFLSSIAYWFLPSGKDFFAPLCYIFSFGIGMIMLVAIANARGLFLSIPRSFRQCSTIFLFFRRKINIYFWFFIFLSFSLVLLCAFLNLGGFVYLLMLMFMIVVFVMFMTIDFGRYQLAAFSNVISAFKDSKNA